MDVFVHQENGAHIISLGGDLTAQAEEKIMSAFRSVLKVTPHISVDLSAVEYLNSGGIAVLIGMVQEAMKQGGSVKIINPDPHHKKIFTMIGLTKFVTVETRAKLRMAHDGERRSFGRTEVSMPVAISVALHEGQRQWTCASRDISPSGIFLFTDQNIDRGAHVNMEFTLPGTRTSLRIHGEVIRAQEETEEIPSGIGIMFRDLPPSAQDAITKYVEAVGKWVEP